MPIKTISRSFAAGIIGPELFGRLDLAKFQTGLAECKNFWTLPHGPAQNRSGFGYVLEAKDSTKKVRVIPFSYNTEQTFVIEFGDQYVRWHTGGGTLLETGLTITGVSKANPGVLTYTGTDPSNGDWMYLSGIVGMTELNGRYVKVAGVDAGANTFQLTDIHGGGNINTSGYTTYASGGTAARVYTLATPYVETDLFDLHFVQSADVLTITHPSYAPRELRRTSATVWVLSTITFAPTIATPATPTAAPGGPGGGTPADYYYKVTALAAETLEESLASASVTASVDMAVAGNYIDVFPAALEGAVRHNVYKFSNGLYGYIGQMDVTAAASFRDNNITPDVSQTPPMANTPFTGAGDYPGAVGYHEQRRCFGGTNTKPQNFWATRSATENNLSYSIPSRDDDAIAFRIAAREVNRIRHIVSVDQLLLLTSGGEWKIAPQNSDILTPASAAPKQIANEGASNVQPVLAANSVLYIQESGSRLRELKYKWEANGYDVRDLSLMAPHLFDKYSVVDMAYAKTPNKIVWVVRSDGVLLGLTYLPEHEVFGWHEHNTDGLFESVACVKEGNEHVLYAVVKRTINARAVRYIERLHTRQFTDPEDAFFVDCGVTYDGAAADTFSGLWHLEGEDLTILADGAEVTGLSVLNGAVTLPNEASVAHFGKAITADIKTLPLSFEAQASGQGLMKNINGGAIRVQESSGWRVGPTFNDVDMVGVTMRTDEPYGTAPALATGIVDVAILPEWGDDAQLCIRQTAPLPVTILAVTLEVAIGG
jgi:hypothetical protein